MKKTIFVLSIAATLILGCANSNNNSKNSEPTVEEGLEIGNRAPELAYESPKGEVLKLSDLRGKLVLIDFWASWCPPCRRENPNIVSAYNTFKDAKFKGGDGLAIYSVSFDKNKDNWEKAIATDNLSWPWHVSDLKGWESEASYIYNIESIPSNVLIDENGIILARNLRDENLISTLENLKK